MKTDETCRNCGGPVSIQIRKGTGACCNLCEKALRRKAADV